MGRIRQEIIKRTAMKIVEEYKNELTTDFEKNREFLDSILKVEGKTMRNRIAGYVTSVLKQKNRS